MVPAHTQIDRGGFSSADAVIVGQSNYHDASSIHEWRIAIKEELDVLDPTSTWDLVPLPSHAVHVTMQMGL
jgi:hypothetical protein